MNVICAGFQQEEVKVDQVWYECRLVGREEVEDAAT